MENSLLSHFATSNPPIYRQILRLPCVEDTPIPKFITEWKEAVYEKDPPFRFGFSNKWSSNIACSERRKLLIIVDKQGVTIKPTSSDLTINARPFIMNPVSSGWRQHLRVYHCPRRFPDHPSGRLPRTEKVEKTRVSRQHPAGKSARGFEAEKEMII